MALAVSNIIPHSSGDELIKACIVALDNNYPAGGYSFSASAVGLTKINRFKTQDQSGFGFEYDYTNQKLKVYGAGSGGLNFVGAPMGNHSHDLDNFTNSSVLSTIRMYLSAVVGAPAPGDTVTGAASLAAANVVAYVGDAGYITVNGVVGGPFTTGENLTFAPSGATATLRGNLVDAWTFIPALEANDVIIACSNQSGDGLIRAAAVFATTQDLSTNQYRFYQALASLETNNADGWTTVYVEGTRTAVSAESAGTPSGSITGGGGAVSEVTPGTDLSAVNNIECEIWGF